MTRILINAQDCPFMKVLLMFLGSCALRLTGVLGSYFCVN
uniref:Uncharacterized protein n=1 Tax=Anguilla anguilla TaxID=7936 RepID=A0A0E9S5V1_ANGAN